MNILAPRHIPNIILIKLVLSACDVGGMDSPFCCDAPWRIEGIGPTCASLFPLGIRKRADFSRDASLRL